MTTNPSPPDWRGLCEELADSIELLLEMRPVDAKPLNITEERYARARAALAQPEPEVVGPELTDQELLAVASGLPLNPDDDDILSLQRSTIAADRARFGGRPAPARPPEPEGVGPTDEELANHLISAGVDAMEGESDGTGRMYWEGWNEQVMAAMRAAIAADRARYGRPSPVPAGDCPACEGTPKPGNQPCAVCGRLASVVDGEEVAGLAWWLRSLEDASVWFETGSPEAQRLARAADLLERQAAPAPAGEAAELAALIRQIAMAWAPDTCLLGNMTAGQLTRAAELLERQAVAEESSVAPVPVASDTRYEFSVLDADCTEQAGGSAPTYAQALSEGQHYLAQYQQDGPHTLEVRRVEVLHPDALPVLPEGVHVIEPAERTILVPAPVPVAVSERPWEREGWCDEDGRCWMGRRRIGSDPGPRLAPIWALQRPDTTSCFYSHALPFNALPLPSGEVE